MSDRIIGSTIELVPFTEIFIERYFEWMKDEYILQMTASEPMSLDDVKGMQNRFEVDGDKSTFIALIHPTSSSSSSSLSSSSSDVHINQIDRMIGDINFFFSNEDLEADSNIDQDNNPDTSNTIVSNSIHTNSRSYNTAEINMMVADVESRGKGYGKEILILSILYAYYKLGIRKFIAKIKSYNTPSIKLFERCYFKKVNYVAVFEEYEYVLHVHDRIPVPISQQEIEGSKDPISNLENTGTSNFNNINNSSTFSVIEYFDYIQTYTVVPCSVE